MKTLCLLRHAKSSWADPSLDDVERPLSSRGRRAAATMARHMEARGLVPGIILCSPARRTVETWSLMAERVKALGDVHYEPELYFTSWQRVLAQVRGASDEHATMLVVGHNPSLEELAYHLAGRGEPSALQRLARKYPTAALAVIVFETDRWAGVRENAGVLSRFVTPRDLAE